MAPDASLVDRTAIASAVFDRALLRGTFTLRSGAVSDRYFDKFRATSDPALLRVIGSGLADALTQLHGPAPARIVAPALGAVPLAVALALETGLPYAIVRNATKSYGTANRIEGPVRSGEVAVLVEDVVTSGGAAIDALQVVREAGLVVTDALCVLDRDGGGREALAELGVTLHALLDATDLDAAFSAGLGQEVVTP